MKAKLFIPILLILLLGAGLFLLRQCGDGPESRVRQRFQELLEAAEKSGKESPIQSLALINNTRKAYLSENARFEMGAPFSARANPKEMSKQLVMIRGQLATLALNASNVRTKVVSDSRIRLTCTLVARYTGARSGRQIRNLELGWIKEGKWKVEYAQAATPGAE